MMQDYRKQQMLIAEEIGKDTQSLRLMGYSVEEIEALEQGVVDRGERNVYSWRNIWPAMMAYAARYGNVEKTLKRVDVDINYSDYMRAGGMNPGNTLLKAPVHLFGLEGNQE